MSRVPTPEELGAYVDEAANLIGLPIAPAHRPGVIQYLGGIMGAATLVMEFALPDDVEQAPVFEP
jgi:1-carboxybiuret hydrolase subunit AtzG-like protein